MKYRYADPVLQVPDAKCKMLLLLCCPYPTVSKCDVFVVCADQSTDGWAWARTRGTRRCRPPCPPSRTRRAWRWPAAPPSHLPSPSQVGRRRLPPIRRTVIFSVFPYGAIPSRDCLMRWITKIFDKFTELGQTNGCGKFKNQPRPLLRPSSVNFCQFLKSIS
jgi:hypothetical protein